MKTIPRIFGPNNVLLYPYVELIIEENIGRKYFFMNIDEWQRTLLNTRSHGNKIYWIELLNRVHYTSIINLLRIRKWLDSISLSYENKNLLSFCSSMRGLIEFGSDANFTLRAIPFHLAEKFTEIKSVFVEDKKEFIIDQALEDALLHFSYAGKQTKKDERSKVYNAKQIKEYIEYSDREGKLYDFYQYISGFIHPSTESVTSYFEIEKHDIGEYLKIEEKDEKIINELISDNQKLFDSILCLSIYPSLFNLKMLTMFEIDDFRCQSIMGLSYEQFATWNEIKSKMKN